MAKLILIQPSKTQEFELTEKITSIGRVPEATICLPEKKASKLHCQILQENGNFILIDLASSNGTRINGRKISRETLKHEDEIQIGEITLHFHHPEAISEFESESVPILRVPTQTTKPLTLKEITTEAEPKRKFSKSPQKLLDRKDYPYLVFLSFAFAFFLGMWRTSSASSSLEELSTLLANPSFETSQNALPLHWTFTGSLGAVVSLAQDFSSPHGEKYLKLRTQEGQSDSYFMALSEPIEVEGNSFYQIEAFLKYTGTTAGIFLLYSMVSQEPQEETHFCDPTSEWKRFQCMSRAPALAQKLQVGLVLFGPQGSASFDQIRCFPCRPPEAFPKNYTLNDLSFNVFSKGQWELSLENSTERKPFFFETEWQIYHQKTRSVQSQLKTKTWTNTSRRFEFQGELFDFNEKKWEPLTFSFQQNTAQFLLTYQIPEYWLHSDYLPLLRWKMNPELMLWIEGQDRTLFFENSFFIQTLQVRFPNTPLLEIHFKNPVRIRDERDGLTGQPTLEIYPQHSELQIEIHLPVSTETDWNNDWITGVSQFQKNYFGKAMLAFQNVIQKAPTTSAKALQAKDKIQEIQRKTDEDLQEIRKKWKSWEESPSSEKKEQLLYRLQELNRYYDPLPVTQEFQKILQKLSEKEPSTLHKLDPPEKTKPDPPSQKIAEKLYELGMNAYKKREFLKAKIYFSTLLKENDPNQQWKIKLQSVLEDLDETIRFR